MVRILKFDGSNETDKLRFGTLFGAFCLGGNRLLNQSSGARSRDERAKDAKVLKALKAIAFESTEGADGSRKTYRLGDEGGEVRLDQKQHKLLMSYVEAAPFPTEQSDQLDDLLDWLDAAPSEDK